MGLGLQALLALFILKAQAGKTIFDWLSSRVEEFLAHTDKGAEFVFGDTTQHPFLMKVRSTT